MASSKKPRKKHNKNKLAQVASDRVSKNSFLFCAIKAENEEKGNIWVKNGIPQKRNFTNLLDFDLTFRTPRPWSLTFGLAYRNIAGQTFCKIEHVALSNRMALRSEGMNKFIDDELNNMCAENDLTHVITPFFIASPEKREFTDEEIDKLLHISGMYEDLKTPHEVRQLRTKGMEELRQIDPVPFCTERTWKILRQNGIADFSQVRLQGLNEIIKIKGIGKKRCDELIEGYHKLLEHHGREGGIDNLLEFEVQIQIHLQAMQRLKRKE